MITNLYAIPKLSNEQKNILIEHLLNDKFFEVQEMMPKQIHVGRFVGQQHFTFDHNDWEYYSNPREMFEFLKNCVLHDENGKDINFDDFLRKINEITPTTEKDLPHSNYVNYGYIKDGYYFSDTTRFT